MNIHAADGEEVTASGARPSFAQPVRKNNRGPPRGTVPLTSVPFEAIPLEVGNSAAQRPTAVQQLPFGVLRPPRPVSSNSNPNFVPDLPFTAGVSLPAQLVPPVSQRPWPLPPLTHIIDRLPVSAHSINATTATESTEVVDEEVTESTTHSMAPVQSESTGAVVEKPDWPSQLLNNDETSSFSFFSDEVSNSPTNIQLHPPSESIASSPILETKSTVQTPAFLSTPIEAVSSEISATPTPVLIYSSTEPTLTSHHISSTPVVAPSDFSTRVSLL